MPGKRALCPDSAQHHDCIFSAGDPKHLDVTQQAPALLGWPEGNQLPRSPAAWMQKRILPKRVMQTSRQLGMQLKKQILVGAGAQGKPGEAERRVDAVGEKAKGDLIAPCWDGAEEAEVGSPRRCPTMRQEALAQNVTWEIVITYPRLLRNEVF